jgi:hypothetical protein
VRSRKGSRVTPPGRRRGLAGAGALALAALGADPSPALARPEAWVLGPLQRAVAADGAAPAAGGTTASLAAARNEAESFQIVVRADDGAALEGVTVGVSDLAGPGGAVIPARDLALHRAHYVEVAEPSPGGAPGRYPDALVPFRDPLTGRAPAGGAAVRAQGVAVEAGLVGSFWVDVRVPADATPGAYKGTWWARAGSSRVGGGAVEVEVWRVALPAVPALRSSVNQWSDHSHAADAVLAAHGLSSLWVDPGTARKLADRSPLSAAGLGFWSGAEAGTACRMSRPPSPAQVAQRAASFPQGLLLYNLTAQGIGGCPELAPLLADWAAALRGAGVANMVVGAPAPDLLGSVDVWAVGPAEYHASPERVRAAVAGGAQVWATTALAEDADAPAWLLDHPLLGYRLLPGFVGQSLGFAGLHYWAADHWAAGDPWRGAFYRSADGRAWPGEGLLVYPGAPAGVQGVVPSIRLKAVRDGVEDFGLLALARARGLPGLEREIEAVAGRGWRGATGDPAVLEAARRRIGRALSDG